MKVEVSEGTTVKQEQSESITPTSVNWSAVGAESTVKMDEEITILLRRSKRIKR